MPQLTSRSAFRLGGVPSYQIVDEATAELIPEERPVRITRFDLSHQTAGNVEERLIIAPKPLDQLRFKRTILCRYERELPGINGDQ
jgi:hypothetical protein